MLRVVFARIEELLESYVTEAQESVAAGGSARM
jgi:hypothetical protein